VARPRAEVASFMFDPANDMAWTTGIVSSRPEQPGRLQVGHRVVRTAKFLGRTFDYLFEVLAAEHDSFDHMKVDKLFRYPSSASGASWIVCDWPRRARRPVSTNEPRDGETIPPSTIASRSSVTLPPIAGSGSSCALAPG